MKITPVTPAAYSQPVNPSSATEKSQQQTSQSAQPRMVSGPELVDLFADMFAYPPWSEKGVELTQETKDAIFQAVQNASRDAASRSDEGYRMHINTHQIVMDHQPVPDWFREEKSMVDEVSGAKDRFPKGEYYAISYEEEENESIRGFSPVSLKAGQLDELMKELYAQNPLSEQA